MTALRWLAGGPGSPRFAIVAAHPDDESIGAGGQLTRLRDALYVHVTDGAPRDGHDARLAGFDDAAAYARARRREWLDVAAMVGIAPDRCLALGVPDQEAVHHVGAIARELAFLFRRHHIEAVLTHAYEGGHPDHDATACAVALAIGLARPDQAPELIEMTSYNAAGVGRFLPTAPGPFLVPLSPEMATCKLQALARYRTQAAVIDWLAGASTLFERELFRAAPAYDFAAPPHAGPLHYEGFGWNFDGNAWRNAIAPQLREVA